MSQLRMDNRWIIKRLLMLFGLTQVITATVAWLTYVEEDEPLEQGLTRNPPSGAGAGWREVLSLPTWTSSGPGAPPPSPWHGVEQSWLN